MSSNPLKLPVLGLVLLSVCLSQNPAAAPEKAPEEVETALRARIGEFYQAQVDGKFRLAYELVADDSKDQYFAADKEKYLDYSILKIEYAENFTQAKAVVACGKEVAALGKRYQVKMPLASRWKLTDGKWYWFTTPSQEIETPFGVMRPGPGDAKDVALAREAPRLEALRKMVKVDKREVKLNMSEPSSDQVVVTNYLPGSVSLALDYRPTPGLEITLDRQDLKVNETANISFRFSPAQKGPKPLLTAWLRVSPTNQTIPLRVTFSGKPRPASPPEDKK
jgi:hypothetical protein